MKRIKNIYYWGWNSGVLRYYNLFLNNEFFTSFELFSIHLQKGTIKNKLLTITIFNISWTISILQNFKEK